MKQEINIQRFHNGQLDAVRDSVVVERNMELVVNGGDRLFIAMAPEDMEAFTVGYLMTSGLLDRLEDLREVRIHDGQIHVTLERVKPVNRSLPTASTGLALLESLKEKSPFAKRNIPDLPALPALFEEFNRQSVVFRQTGGVHSAALSDGTGVSFFTEDIGRHNALDKTIGKALLAGVELEDYFLLTSGRVSGEITKKCYFAGVPTIVSHSAPTSMALERAAQFNMTIIGFLRGQRFNIYTPMD